MPERLRLTDVPGQPRFNRGQPGSIQNTREIIYALMDHTPFPGTDAGELISGLERLEAEAEAEKVLKAPQVQDARAVVSSMFEKGFIPEASANSFLDRLKDPATAKILKKYVLPVPNKDTNSVIARTPSLAGDAAILISKDSQVTLKGIGRRRFLVGAALAGIGVISIFTIEEANRQEAVRQEAIRAEAARQEAVSQEAERQETVRKEAARAAEALRQAEAARQPPVVYELYVTSCDAIIRGFRDEANFRGDFPIDRSRTVDLGIANRSVFPVDTTRIISNNESGRTDIRLKAGQTLEISATGRVHSQLMYGIDAIDPDGNLYLKDGIHSPKTDWAAGGNEAPAGMLIGRLGSGPRYRIGSHWKGSADRDGDLYFSVNFSTCVGNSGGFDINVTVYPPAYPHP